MTPAKSTKEDISTEVSPEAFDPLTLRPEASLNRTRFVDLPGADPALVGRPAFEVLSLVAYDALAENRAVTFGRRIAHLIASLRQPEPLASWRQAYLAHWRTIEVVYLGGGLTAALGQPFVDAARVELDRLCQSAPRLELARYPSALALVGVARSHLDTPGPVAVFDFGQTSIKRGIATFVNDHLEHVQLQSNLSAPAEADVVKFVLDTLEGQSAIVSIASYVANDRPIGRYGLYSPLAALNGFRLSGVTFVHDGTAAARAIATDKTAAVIMLGTALGVGFASSSSTLVPLSPTFSLS